MARRPLILVSGTLVAALTLLVLVGLRVLERDRDKLFSQYAHERQLGVEEAARSLTNDVQDIGEDLELAAALLPAADSAQVAERELHAIATIKREYLAVYAHDDAGETTLVTAYNTPPGLTGLADASVHELLARATSEPGRLHVSRAFSTDPTAAWYRVFARRPRDHGPVVAVIVDMTVLLGRMKLPRDSKARVNVLDADQRPSPTSDAAVAALVPRDAHEPIMLDEKLAQRAGLPRAKAIGIAVPLAIDPGPPWRIVVVASAQSLQTQERTIVLRVLAGSGIVLVLLLSAGAYVLHNTFRARALRDRVTILDHIPSGVLALSSNLDITASNRRYVELAGRDVAGMALSSAFEHASPEEARVIADLAKRALQTREAQYLHHERIAVFGDETALDIHAVPLATSVGDVSVLLVFDDVTELRRIEDQLLHSEKLVTAGQLAAGIAHEIGTPLNVARGRVELALSHLGSTHDEAGNHRVVIDQIDRVTRLIQQLLDYVRPAPVSIHDVDLGHALHVARDLVGAQAAKRKVVLDVDASAAPTVRADPDQVQQIVVNLVLNAIDACDAGGTVTLRASRRGQMASLEVIDTGQGIPPELQKQVFDPFFTTKKRGQGTGLGLWVVAQLVRAQSAEIQLDSVPGRGTTVRVLWPMNA